MQNGHFNDRLSNRIITLDHPISQVPAAISIIIKPLSCWDPEIERIGTYPIYEVIKWLRLTKGNDLKV